MRWKFSIVLIAVFLLGGCATGGVSLGASDAGDARSMCAGQMAQRQMSPQQEQRFMHTCMAGYGYGHGDKDSKPFTVKMPSHDQQQH